MLAAAAALLIARPLFPSESASMGDGLALVMLWLALALFWLLESFWLLRAEGARRAVLPIRFGWVDAAVLALAAWHSLAALVAITHTAPRPAWNMLWQWVGMAVAFLVLRQLLRSEREGRALVATMIALALGLSVYGFYQTAVELPASRALYRNDPDAALRAAGVWYPPDSPQRELFESRLANTEPLATFALTNSLAGLLAPWLVVAVGIGLYGWPRTREGDKTAPRADPPTGLRRLWNEVSARTGPVALVAVVIAVCLVLTRGRSALAATFLGLVLLGFDTRFGRRYGLRSLLAVAVVASLVVSAAAAAGTLDRGMLLGAGRSLLFRLEYWRATAVMIAERPLFGCGPGNFRDFYTAHKLPEASEEVADPHNFLLEVWATAGTPAALALAAALGIFFYLSFCCRQKRTAQESTGGETAPGWSAAPWPIYAGCAAGFLLALPIGLTSQAPPNLAATLIALPASGLGLALLHPWVDRGRLPPHLPAIAVAVLLIHLTAAGGIGYPGVAGTLWLLMAVGLTVPGSDSPQAATESDAGQACHASTRLGRRGVGALALVAGGLTVACYVTAYAPVTRSRAVLGEALVAQDPRRVEALLEAAAAADPLAADPWSYLAAWHFQRWSEAPSAEHLAGFEAASRKVLDLLPHNSGAWELHGTRLLAVYQHSGDGSRAEEAVGSLHRAVELYPNSATTRGKLAVALKVSGDRDAARREADRALRLDRLTPHPDKKLPAELRQRLERITG